MSTTEIPNPIAPSGHPHFDIVVVGGGPGGYATALYGSAAGLRVAIVERDRVGGTCLHRGCVPAKEFLETAAVFRTVKGAEEFGVRVSGVSLDFMVNQTRKNAIVEQLFRGLSGLLKKRHITIFSGTGQLQPEHRVRIIDGKDEGTTIVGTHVVLAPGSIPRTLPEIEIDGTVVVTSDDFLEVTTVPPSVAVLGGGAVGCEFASLLCDLGSRVVLVEALDTILSGCDKDVVEVVRRSFRKRGIDVVAGARLEGHEMRPDGKGIVLRLAEGRDLDVTMVIVSVGRRPRTDDLLADGTGVTIDDRGFVVTDEFQSTTAEGVWAVGDVVAGTPQLAHVGFAEAIVAVKRIIGEPVDPVDHEKVPWAIYCHPEVAFAGLTENQAVERGFKIVTKTDPLGGNSRARILGETDGLTKVVAEMEPDGSAGRILGVHMVGPWATEQLGSGYLAVNWEATPDDVATYIQPHPSLSEAFGETMLALTGRGLHVD